MRLNKWLLGVLAVVVVLLLAVGYPLLRGWTGDRSVRALRPGETVAMDNGLSLTVPPGWTGYYTQYYRIPKWLPIGEAAGGMFRSDLLGLDSGQAAGSARVHVTAWSNYVDRRLKREQPLAATDSAAAFGSPGAVYVDLRVKGKETGVIGASHSGLEGRELLSYLWTTLEIRGVVEPQ